MNIQNQQQSKATIIILSLLAAIIFSLNLLNLKGHDSRSPTPTDELGAPWADSIVRYTIKNHILGHKNQNVFLTLSEGLYYNSDYTFSPDNNNFYHYTGLYIHAFVLAKVAGLIGVKTEAQIDKYLILLRFLCAFLLSFFIISYLSNISTMLGFRQDLALFGSFYALTASFGIYLWFIRLKHTFDKKEDIGCNVRTGSRRPEFITERCLCPRVYCITLLVCEAMIMCILNLRKKFAYTI